MLLRTIERPFTRHQFHLERHDGNVPCRQASYRLIVLSILSKLYLNSWT